MQISAGRCRVQCAESLPISGNVWQLKGDSCPAAVCTIQQEHSTCRSFSSHTQYLDISFHLVLPIAPTLCISTGNLRKQVSTNKVAFPQETVTKHQRQYLRGLMDNWWMYRKNQFNVKSMQIRLIVFFLNVCAPVVIVVEQLREEMGQQRLKHHRLS